MKKKILKLNSKKLMKNLTFFAKLIENKFFLSKLKVQIMLNS